MNNDEKALKDVLLDKEAIPNAQFKATALEKELPETPSETWFAIITGFAWILSDGFLLDFIKKISTFKNHKSAVSTLVPTIMPNIVGPLSDALAVVSMSLGTVQLARHLQLHPKSMEFF